MAVEQEVAGTMKNFTQKIGYSISVLIPALLFVAQSQSL
jgi:hypothetical protein